MGICISLSLSLSLSPTSTRRPTSPWTATTNPTADQPPEPGFCPAPTLSLPLQHTTPSRGSRAGPSHRCPARGRRPAVQARRRRNHQNIRHLFHPLPFYLFIFF